MTFFFSGGGWWSRTLPNPARSFLSEPRFFSWDAGADAKIRGNAPTLSSRQTLWSETALRRCQLADHAGGTHWSGRRQWHRQVHHAEDPRRRRVARLWHGLAHQGDDAWVPAAGWSVAFGPHRVRRVPLGVRCYPQSRAGGGGAEREAGGVRPGERGVYRRGRSLLAHQRADARARYLHAGLPGGNGAGRAGLR